MRVRGRDCQREERLDRLRHLLGGRLYELLTGIINEMYLRTYEVFPVVDSMCETGDDVTRF